MKGDAQKIRNHMVLWDPLPVDIRTTSQKKMYHDQLLTRIRNLGRRMASFAQTNLGSDQKEAD